MLDFQDLKARVSIEDAVKLLGLSMKPEGNQLRGACPACNQGGDRAIVVTPEKGVYYCFSQQKGGDVISLTAKIRGCSVKEAAEFLDQGTPATVPEKKKGQDSTGELKPLTYLDSEHELVTALGIPSDVCKAVGIGHASKGVMRGTVAVPIRLPTGQLIGYIGFTGEVKLPKEWRMT